MKTPITNARRIIAAILISAGFLSWVSFDLATGPLASTAIANASTHGYSTSPPGVQVNPQSRDRWSGIGPAPSINALAIDPANPDIVYAGSFHGVFKSKDAGATWSFTLLGYTGELVIDSVNPNIVYAGTSGSGAVFAPGGPMLYKTTDGGESWSNRNSPIVFDISLLVMDRFSPATLYAGSAARYLNGDGSVPLKSTDGGVSWKELATGDIGLAPWGWAIDQVDSQTIYAAGEPFTSNGGLESGLFKSIDGGGSWSATGLTRTVVSRVAIDPVNPDTLYAGTYPYANAAFNGLLKSTDRGATWLAINNGLPDLVNADAYISDLVIDPDDPNIIYASTAGYAGLSGLGVFRSVDGGANWTPYNDGLTNLYVTALSLAPANPNTLYAATPAGVFKTVDNIPGQPVPIPQISAVSVVGKKLFLFGDNFDAGAVILINGEEQITRNGQNPRSELIGKKAGKKIRTGDKLQVRNPNGALSPEFVFTVVD